MAIPCRPGLKPQRLWIVFSAPEMTTVSKPKRNPASAEVSDQKKIRRFIFEAGELTTEVGTLTPRLPDEEMWLIVPRLGHQYERSRSCDPVLLRSLWRLHESVVEPICRVVAWLTRIVICHDLEECELMCLDFRFQCVRYRIVSQKPAVCGVQHVAFALPKSTFGQASKQPTCALPSGP